MDFSEQLEQLKRLAGIYTPYAPKDEVQENISHTGTEKSKFMKKHKIEPGTEEWFRLWFSRPYLTHVNPFGKSE
jgi:hypothetical protein